ncbi:hydrogenase expression/formation protein HypE [Ectothiorhodospira mobilis]|uniref:hydrogenase expression/formation protein HypE n=1 Tax=Ectothiorhodospira mobilis TaxID=195064 RepID=UPI001903D9A7|nr:hydrogenase expression/formation protein HypE [Ectothiorhodospira mobilis]MBK1691905.1 hydrogenase expression/formation protein HypE [Ectothiorhodospira mobilis]
MPLYPIDLERDTVTPAHGSGGRAMTQLVRQLFARAFDNPWLERGEDAAVLDPPAGRLVTATDGHVVTPLFFPGGDIGRLAVNGSVNDVAMAGAVPLALTAGFILEEGLALTTLARIVDSMAGAAAAVGIPVVAGDTKVVPRGRGDGVYITTTALGVVSEGVELAGDRARPGDAILVSGPLGDHGMAVMAAREGLDLDPPIRSDCAPLHDLVAHLLAAVPGVRCLRDPTRGGLACALHEWAGQSGVGMLLEEADLPVRPGVRAACELLGLDPLHVACEGRLVAICPRAHGPRLLQALKAHPLGREAAVVGQVVADPDAFVQVRTPYGGLRNLDWPAGELLPRIC